MDSLGTTSIVTEYSTGAVVQDELHYPWGQEWAVLGTMQEERFARLHHRDSATSLDPTLHRMYSSDQARWMTPDPAGTQSVNFAIPQSFNRYPYALNNPTLLTDPTGLCSDYDYSYTDEYGNYVMHVDVGPCPSAFGYTDLCIYSGYLCGYGSNSWSPYPYSGGGYGGGGAGGTSSIAPPPSQTPAQLPPGVPSLAGVTFQQTSSVTWNFTSQNSFQQTLAEFEQAGLVPDYLDPLHSGYYDLRDQRTFCSVHVDILESSGQAAGEPTTGTVHLDTVNPYGGLGSVVVLGAGSIGFTFAGHEIFDVAGAYPSSSACR